MIYLPILAAFGTLNKPIGLPGTNKYCHIQPIKINLLGRWADEKLNLCFAFGLSEVPIPQSSSSWSLVPGPWAG